MYNEMEIEEGIDMNKSSSGLIIDLNSTRKLEIMCFLIERIRRKILLFLTLA